MNEMRTQSDLGQHHVLKELKRMIERMPKGASLSMALLGFILEKDKELAERGGCFPDCTCDGCLLDKGRASVASGQSEFDFVKAMDELKNT